MNNNRGNNNRRRGRGNNNRPQGGGGGNGQQLNRIDSRARGNAPQLLEKYRKLAQDAHLNGDRVQADYYLQFADHYFRVIADARVRVEEQRMRQNGGVAPAGGERWQEAEEDSMDFSMDADFPAFDRAPQQRDEREPRESNGQREQSPREQGNRDQGQRDNNQRDGGQYDAPRRDSAPREHRERPRFQSRDEILNDTADTSGDLQGVRADEGEPLADSNDNPFVRDNRTASRGLRPRSDRNERTERNADRDLERRPRRPREDAPAALDPAILPPALGPRVEVENAPTSPEAQDAPAPKRRGRPRKNPLPDAPEPVEG